MASIISSSRRKILSPFWPWRSSPGSGEHDSDAAPFFVLPAAWLLGGLWGLQQQVELSLPYLPAITLLTLGALVAADRPLPLPVVTGIALVLGLLHGYSNGTAMAQAGLGLSGLLRIGCSVFTIVALVAALLVSLKIPWARIAIRVAGSWIAAIGMLLLGWTFRGGS